MFDPRFQALDASGKPYSGAKLAFYRAGTTSLVTVYQNATGSTPHTNPVTADTAGVFPAIYLDTIYPLKAILRSAAGVTLQTIDRFDPAPVGVNGNSYTVEAAADLPVPSNEFAEGIVLNDPDPAKNGLWYREAGVWVFGRAFEAGPPGPYTEITFGPVTTVSSTTPASANIVVIDPETVRVDFSIPKGADGDGAGDVVGPSSSGAERVAVFDGITGKLLKDGGKTLSELAIPTAPQGRLSLVSGIPVSASDVTGATSIYYVPAVGAHVPIFDGTAFRARSIGAQLTHVLDNNTGHALYQAAGGVYDEWLFWDGSAVKLGNGPSWAAGAVAGSTTARGTGAGSTELEMHQGFLVNKNSMQVRWGAGAGDITTVPARQATYVGSFAPAVTGQAADTRESRLLFNAHNQTIRSLRRQDPSPSWPYVSSTVRQANGNVANQVSVLLGLSGVFAAVRATAVAYAASSTNRTVGTYISLDGVDVPEDAAGGIFSTTGVTAQTTGICEYQGCPGLGYRAFKWLEFGSTDITFVGTPVSPYTRTGITGHVVM